MRLSYSVDDSLFISARSCSQQKLHSVKFIDFVSVAMALSFIQF